jgi:hypothetical protein
MTLISSDWGMGLLLWLGVAAGYAVTVWGLAHQGPRGDSPTSDHAQPTVFVNGPRLRIEPRRPSAVLASLGGRWQATGAPLDPR